MTRVLWAFGWVGVFLWSLFALAAYGLADVIGAAAMRNADMFSNDPETVEWIWRMFSWAHSASTSIILVVWGCVSLAILGVPWLFERIVGRPPQPRAPQRARDGVIDLAPGDYSVRTPGPTATSPVPRIGPWG